MKETNKKIFESILRERGSQKITSEIALLKALAAKKTVYARETGPFGEDEGATVVAFGNIEDVTDMLKITKELLHDLEYDSKRDFIENMVGIPVIVLSKNIGQTGENFYLLDGGRSVEDCELYV